MVEFETTKARSEIIAHGYEELGVYSSDNKEFNLLVEDALNNKLDILLSELFKDKDNVIFQVYKKGGE